MFSGAFRFIDDQLQGKLHATRRRVANKTPRRTRLLVVASDERRDCRLIPLKDFLFSR
jgi:hypothetical protein